MKPISTRVHGILDFTTAGTLIALPRMLGWSDRVTGVLTGTAIGVLGYSLMTRYEFGILKLLPMPAHLALDGMNGVVMCAAPFTLFAGEDDRVTPALLGIGAFEITASLLTQTEPS